MLLYTPHIHIKILLTNIPPGGIFTILILIHFMQKILSRLKKVHGQIGALINMIENENDCEKITVQFQASKAALSGAFSVFLSENLDRCIKRKDKEIFDSILKHLSSQ